MKDGIIVLYDYDAEYAGNLMGFFNQKQGFPFVVKVATSLESFTDMVETESVSLVMVAECFLKDVSTMVEKKVILVLVEREGSLDGYEEIFRYQAMDNIIQKILTYTRREMPKEGIHAQSGIYGFYSPVGGIGKTTLGIATAKYLSEKEETLLLNISLSREYIFGEEDCDDQKLVRLMLDLRNHSLKNDKKQYFNSKEMFSYVPSKHYQGEFWNITGQEFSYLLEHLRSNNFFSNIILDIGFINESVLEMMRSCNVIYLLTSEKGHQRQKVDGFRQLLEFRQESSIMGKLKEVSVPNNLFNKVTGDDGACYEQKRVKSFVEELVNNET